MNWCWRLLCNSLVMETCLGTHNWFPNYQLLWIWTYYYFTNQVLNFRKAPPVLFSKLKGLHNGYTYNINSWTLDEHFIFWTSKHKDWEIALVILVLQNTIFTTLMTIKDHGCPMNFTNFLSKNKWWTPWLWTLPHEINFRIDFLNSNFLFNNFIMDLSSHSFIWWHVMINGHESKLEKTQISQMTKMHMIMDSRYFIK